MADEHRDLSTLEAIARLEVQLKGLGERIADMQSQMVTRDLFLAQQQNNEFRFRTIEESVSAWRTESASEHVKINAASIERHNLAQSDSKSRHQATVADISKIQDRLDAADESLKTTRNGRIQAFIVAGLAFASSIGVVLFNIAVGR